MGWENVNLVISCSGNDRHFLRSFLSSWLWKCAAFIHSFFCVSMNRSGVSAPSPHLDHLQSTDSLFLYWWLMFSLFFYILFNYLLSIFCIFLTNNNVSFHVFLYLCFISFCRGSFFYTFFFLVFCFQFSIVFHFYSVFIESNCLTFGAVLQILH